VLFDFCTYVSKEPAVVEKELWRAVNSAYERFCQRLRGGSIDCEKIIMACDALATLDVFAYNNLFAAWYGRVKKELPGVLPPRPPEGFTEEWGEEEGGAKGAEEAWAFIQGLRTQG
jgi:hypothetical protein